jgi:asparagine synthase (glutamine-hydrolysing)
MCGIVGIVGLNPLEPVDETRLKIMRDVLRHRGPDGEGLWTEGHVGLGFRRLAIIDVEGGAQPMPNEDGSVWVIFNGEIYNHAKLRPWLEARGHRYRTRSDTETIVHLYEEEGERCVERLQGMFAFAVWDRARRRLLLARDRLGIKPLYFALTDRELVFASEIKAILAGGAVAPALNTAVVPEFLANRYVAGSETFFQGVTKLLPGRTLTWSADDGVRQRRYWALPAEVDGDGMTAVEAAGRVRAGLEAAVQSHLMSDVPLGLFLSGGLDSSALAGLMSRMVRQPIRTFSVGLPDADSNELDYARLVARAVGSAHREVVVTPGEFFDALPRLIRHEDEPIAFTSSVPLYFVSRLAAEDVKVVLTGEGADELFLGYHRYRITHWNDRLGRVYGSLAPSGLRRTIGRSLGRLPRRLGRYAARTFLGLEPGPRQLFCENFAVFPTALQLDLLADPGLLAARDPYETALERYAAAPGGDLDRMSHADLQTYLVELLMKQDQMSMAASIESRVPFLDHEFVERVAAMPGRLKLRGWQTKAVLRTAVQDVVPPEILARRKMGFPVPVGRWLRGPFRPLVDDLVLGPRALARGLFDPGALRRLAAAHRAGAADHGDRLWLLINLELWQRMFLDGEDAAGIMDNLGTSCA